MSEKAPEQTSKPGSRRWRIVMVLCALVVGVGAVAFWAGEKEPEYQGKKLSEWVQAYIPKAYFSRYPADAAAHSKSHEAEVAIRHIGTNALPQLMKWINAETPEWRGRLFG